MRRVGQATDQWHVPLGELRAGCAGSRAPAALITAAIQAGGRPIKMVSIASRIRPCLLCSLDGLLQPAKAAASNWSALSLSVCLLASYTPPPPPPLPLDSRTSRLSGLFSNLSDDPRAPSSRLLLSSLSQGARLPGSRLQAEPCCRLKRVRRRVVFDPVCSPANPTKPLCFRFRSAPVLHILPPSPTRPCQLHPK